MLQDHDLRNRWEKMYCPLPKNCFGWYDLCAFFDRCSWCFLMFAEFCKFLNSQQLFFTVIALKKFGNYVLEQGFSNFLFCDPILKKKFLCDPNMCRLILR